MRVLLVSGHRSEIGHYAPLAKVLRADPRFDIYFTEYAADARNVGDFDPDVVVVLGDRYEMLVRAASFVEARRPLVHIHGGEHTYGSLDERYRYAITALADWHCVATENAKLEVERYLITGEWGAGPRRGFTDTYRKTANCVRVTGAPGLDGIRARARPRGLVAGIIVHYNPAIDERTTDEEWRAIREAIGDRIVTLVKPNGDRFSPTTDGEQWGAEEYRDRLAAAHVIVGNSSAGIIEAPSLGTWCVNVGERQAGRERSGNVMDLPADAGMIRAAIRDFLKRPRYSDGNPYEHPQGRACEGIRDVILLAGQSRAHHRGNGLARDGARGAASVEALARAADPFS